MLTQSPLFGLSENVGILSLAAEWAQSNIKINQVRGDQHCPLLETLWVIGLHLGQFALYPRGHPCPALAAAWVPSVSTAAWLRVTETPLASGKKDHAAHFSSAIIHSSQGNLIGKEETKWQSRRIWAHLLSWKHKIKTNCRTIIYKKDWSLAKKIFSIQRQRRRHNETVGVALLWYNQNP